MSKKDKKEDISTEELKDQEANDTMEQNEGNEETKASGEGEEKSDLEVMTEKYNEVNDKYLRLYSEFENFRKRTQKEKVELYKTAGEDIMVALLPVLDDFERAMKSMEQAEDVKSVKEGVELIHSKFFKSLEQKGLKGIESAVGKEFNLDLHEAIANIPAPDKKLKGKIIDETEKGYTLNDKVIRYTKVVIGE